MRHNATGEAEAFYGAMLGGTETATHNRQSDPAAVPAAAQENPLASCGRGFDEVLADLRGRVMDSRAIVETVPTGWGLLDESVGGLVRGEYAGLVGVPGCGKSTLCDQVITGALRLNPDLKALVFAIETAPLVRVSRLLSARAVNVTTSNALSGCLPLSKLLRGELQQVGQQRALEAIEVFQTEIGDRLRFVDEITAANEIAGAIEAQRPDLVLLDHVGLVHTGFSDSDSEVSRLDACLNRLVRALRNTNAAALFINETPKSALSAEQIDMSMSRGSARFASLAAMFIGLQRIRPEPPDKDPTITASICKSRFGTPDKVQRARFFGGLAYFAWGPVSDADDQERGNA